MCTCVDMMFACFFYGQFWCFCYIYRINDIGFDMIKDPFDIKET